MTPEEILARLLYRDGLMLVIDKPAGVPVHRGPKGGSSLEDDFDALRFGLPRSPALAHRLDKDTSGCLVLGRHRKALAKLGALFSQGKVGKTYVAVVRGAPSEESGRIELKLAKRSPTRGWWVAVDPKGQEAVTDWRVIAHAGALSVLALKPRTGRTHQLRAHLAAVGMPVLGDRIYGREPAAPAGPLLHLHSRRVVLPLKPKEPLVVAAPLSAHISATLASFDLDPATLETAADAAFQD